MKKIIVTAVIVLVAAYVNAQTGMPKELTCTEEAFNFSFSLGTKWKLGAPKMGPVEFTENRPGYIPMWSLRPYDVTDETDLLPSIKKPSSLEAFVHPSAQQNNTSLLYRNLFSAMDKPAYLLPGVNWSPVKSNTLSPYFRENLVIYHP